MLGIHSWEIIDSFKAVITKADTVLRYFLCLNLDLDTFKKSQKALTVLENLVSLCLDFGLSMVIPTFWQGKFNSRKRISIFK
jgi:hypothetical protein